MTNLVLAVPGDPETPTGGYVYDRRLAAALPARWLRLPDGFPAPSAADLDAAHAALEAEPATATLLVDGLAFGALDAGRLDRIAARLFALVHHPLAEEDPAAPGAAALRAAEAAALGHAEGVVVTSPHTADLLVHRYGVPAAKITVATPGLDRVAPSGRAAGRHILSVGSLTPRKGHDVLVAALERLEGWTAEIVGAPRDPATAAALAEAAARLPGLTLTGALTQDLLAERYRAADLFVLASRYEGYGMVLDEAFAHGLPVVATAVGAVPGTVGAAGVLVPPDDPATLAEAIARLLDDPARCAELSARARDAAAARPSWADVAATVRAALTPGGFSAAWLDLREPADARARDPGLMAAAVALAPGELADLGAGTGAMVRAFEGRLPGARWRLIDRDPRTLAEAARRTGAETVLADLAADLTADGAPWGDADLVTATALFDLAGPPWIEALAEALAATAAPLYAALTFDGRLELAPEDPDDGEMIAAFRAHQRTDKGLGGPAAGPDAPAVLAAALAARGYAVRTAPSPWHLEAPRDAALIQELLDGWARAMAEAGLVDAALAAAWRERRRRTDRLTVGHTDLLATLPSR